MLGLNNAKFSAKAMDAIRANMAESFRVPHANIPRVLFHGLLLSCIIAAFWLLDALKDPILSNTVGIEYQPLAKILSVISTLFVVCIYDFLTSVVSKPALFHFVSGFFGLLMMIISALLADPNLASQNRAGMDPIHLVGWIAYFSIEAYGSLMVALFWSFTNSIMDLEQAKGAYGLIIAIAQIGAIVGSTLATNASSVGISQLFLLSALLIFTSGVLVKVYHLVFRDHVTQAVKTRVRSMSESSAGDQSISSQNTLLNLVEDAEYHQNMHASHAPLQQSSGGFGGSGSSHSNSSGQPDNDSVYRKISIIPPHKAAAGLNGDNSGGGAGGYVRRGVRKPNIFTAFFRKFGGFYEGLQLVARHNYTLKLLGVSTLYEVVITVVDYEFKLIGADSVTTQGMVGKHIEDIVDGERFASLLGHFGQFTNFLSFLVSFFGFSYLVHHWGVKHSLMILPTLLFSAVVLINLMPRLWVFFVAVSILKALVFSLHDPVKELLYMPTSEAIKFKSKAWIDVFGSRLAKASGAFISILAHGNIDSLLKIGELPCLLISAFILYLTWSIGTEFQELVSTNTVVGDELTVATFVVDFESPPMHDGASGSGGVGGGFAGYGYREQEREEEGQEQMLGDERGATTRKTKTTTKKRMDATVLWGIEGAKPSALRPGEGVMPALRTDSRGLRPGDVGYDGYDPHLFEGVFDDQQQEEEGRGLGQGQRQGQTLVAERVAERVGEGIGDIVGEGVGEKGQQQRDLQR